MAASVKYPRSLEALASSLTRIPGMAAKSSNLKIAEASG
jgi:hypothetical protein